MSRKFKGFFRPKLGDLPKKKKKKKKKEVFAKIQGDFPSHFASSNVSGGALFVWGGAIFHFSQKIGLKSTKNMRFCILHKPMGGARAPPAPPWLRYCTLVRYASKIELKYGTLVRYGSRCEVRITQILNVPYRTAILEGDTYSFLLGK